MTATDILYEEHRVIMKVLACLEKMILEIDAEGKLNTDAAANAIDFFRNFADRCHHAKEEDRLFIVMEDHGIPRENGPIGVMLDEHVEGRRCVRGMAQAIDEASGETQETPAALLKFREHAGDLIALLSAHIQKEDQVLFPMADQALDEQAAETLLHDFRDIEADAGGKRHQHYIDIAKQLCEQYQIPFLDTSEFKTIDNEFMS